jgi:hypothetical protein
MQLQITFVSPEANRANAASRSDFCVEPSMCSALTPALLNSSQMWIECGTLTAKATVLRPSLCLNQ